MFKLLTRYASIGVINTLIHWVIFSVLLYNGLSQAVSNLTAFAVAVTFSFFANAKWTFTSEATFSRYVFYTLFMGFMALSVGWVGDKMLFLPVVTLILFSAASLICGFIYSKMFIFRERR